MLWVRKLLVGVVATLFFHYWSSVQTSASSSHHSSGLKVYTYNIIYIMVIIQYTDILHDKSFSLNCNTSYFQLCHFGYETCFQKISPKNTNLPKETWVSKAPRKAPVRLLWPVRLLSSTATVPKNLPPCIDHGPRWAQKTSWKSSYRPNQ